MAVPEYDEVETTCLERGNGFDLATWTYVNDRTMTGIIDAQGPPPPYTGNFAVYDADLPQQLDFEVEIIT